MGYELINFIPHPEVGTRKLYYLTQAGKDLVYTLTHLVRWSSEHLQGRIFIPDDKLKILRNHPELMIDNTLAELKNWEEKVGLSIR